MSAIIYSNLLLFIYKSVSASKICLNISSLIVPSKQEKSFAGIMTFYDNKNK